MIPEIDTLTIALLAIVIAFFVIALLVGVTIKIIDFRHELNYLNREIARTVGPEREYWKQERRHLWLSLLPFFR